MGREDNKADMWERGSIFLVWQEGRKRQNHKVSPGRWAQVFQSPAVKRLAEALDFFLTAVIRNRPASAGLSTGHRRVGSIECVMISKDSLKEWFSVFAVQLKGEITVAGRKGIRPLKGYRGNGHNGGETCCHKWFTALSHIHLNQVSTLIFSWVFFRVPAAFWSVWVKGNFPFRGRFRARHFKDLVPRN